MGRRPGARLHHADDGHGEVLLGMGEASGRGRVAGDDDHLHVPADEPRADLLHEAVHLGLIARPIGAARRVAEVQDGLLRQALLQRAGHREAPVAGIEHPDGAVVEMLYSCTTTTSPTDRSP